MAHRPPVAPIVTDAAATPANASPAPGVMVQSPSAEWAPQSQPPDVSAPSSPAVGPSSAPIRQPTGPPLPLRADTFPPPHMQPLAYAPPSSPTTGSPRAPLLAGSPSLTGHSRVYSPRVYSTSTPRTILPPPPGGAPQRPQPSRVASLLLPASLSSAATAIAGTLTNAASTTAVNTTLRNSSTTGRAPSFHHRSTASTDDKTEGRESSGLASPSASALHHRRSHFRHMRTSLDQSKMLEETDEAVEMGNISSSTSDLDGSDYEEDLDDGAPTWEGECGRFQRTLGLMYQRRVHVGDMPNTSSRTFRNLPATSSGGGLNSIRNVNQSRTARPLTGWAYLIPPQWRRHILGPRFGGVGSGKEGDPENPYSDAPTSGWPAFLSSLGYRNWGRNVHGTTYVRSLEELATRKEVHKHTVRRSRPGLRWDTLESQWVAESPSLGLSTRKRPKLKTRRWTGFVKSTWNHVKPPHSPFTRSRAAWEQFLHRLANPPPASPAPPETNSPIAFGSVDPHPVRPGPARPRFPWSRDILLLLCLFLDQAMSVTSLFFLFIIIVQQIPGVSPFDRWVILFPWGLNLVAMSLLRWTDMYRYHSDHAVDTPQAQVYDHSTTAFVPRPIDQIGCGALICIRDGEQAPCDVVCLATSERQGWCLVDHSSLYGTEHLDIKMAPASSRGCNTPALLPSLQGKVALDYRSGSDALTRACGGKLSLASPEAVDEALGASNLLPRGARVKFTAYVYGVVINPCPSAQVPLESGLTGVERKVDRITRVIIAALVIISFFCAVGGVVQDIHDWKGRQYLLSTSHSSSAQAARTFFKDWLAFLVCMSLICPLWIPFLLRLVKRTFGLMIAGDSDLYDAHTDKPAQCRRPQLLDEMGQIDYVFLDKTGTLTTGDMHLAHISVVGRSYAKAWDETKAASIAALPLGPGGKPNLTTPPLSWADLADRLMALDRAGMALGYDPSTSGVPPGIWGPGSPTFPTADAPWSKDRVMHEMLVALSICHTVIPYWTGDKITYQGTSPDEVGAVFGAAQLGYRLIARQPGEIFVNFCKQETDRFEVLHLSPFSSSRRCMSLLVRCPDGMVRLYVKGADQVIFPRLSDHALMAQLSGSELPSTLRHLNAYALDGLRTMVYAARDVSEGEYVQWERALHRELQAGSSPRETDTVLAEMMDVLAGQSLTLLGATGAENVLADGVVDTIQAFHRAGLKLFVVSGDQRDTVLSTAVESKVLDPHLNLVEIDQPDVRSAAEHAQQVLRAYYETKRKDTADKGTFALVLHGAALDVIGSKGNLVDGRAELLDVLLDLILLSQVVLVPRATAENKLALTSWLRTELTACILAAGDGVNDQGMLHAAHVGVGIATTAQDLAADVTLAEFRMLRKLLLVHGSWSYARVSKMVLYALYSNVALYGCVFWYAIQSGWSGQAPVEGWEFTFFFSTFFVLPPALGLGLFDKPLNARMLERFPQLYGSPLLSLQRGYDFLLNGLVHSAVTYLLVAWGTWDVVLLDGYSTVDGIFGQTLFFSALLTVLVKAVVMSNTINIYTFAAWGGTYFSALVYGLLWTIIAPAIPHIQLAWSLRHLVPRLYTFPLFWFATLLCPVVANFRDLFWRFWQRTYRPEMVHLVQEVQKLNVQDYKARLNKYQKNRKQAAPISLPRRKWGGGGFAFAQMDPPLLAWPASRLSSSHNAAPYRGWTQTDFVRTFDSSLARLPPALPLTPPPDSGPLPPSSP